MLVAIKNYLLKMFLKGFIIKKKPARGILKVQEGHQYKKGIQ